MCSCAEEVIEWISDWQFDIQEEINATKVARLSSLVVQAVTPETSSVRKLDDSVIGLSAWTVAKCGPFAIGGLRNVIPRVKRTTSTAVDSDEEPLLPQEQEIFSLRSPPPGATQVEEAILDQADSTFLDHFERDLGVLPAVHTSANRGHNGRFAALTQEDSDVMLEVRACRRQVAASSSFPPTAVDPVMPTEVAMPEEETESIFSAVPESEVGSDEEVEVESEADVAPADHQHMSKKVSSVWMKVPPTFLRGACRSAMRLALQEITCGMEFQNHLRVLRGWKLFILIPRMLCCCSDRHKAAKFRKTSCWTS